MANLEPWMVSNQILPALPKINSKEPGILMACLGIYKIANETDKFGISTEQCAKSVGPFPTNLLESVSIDQFEQFMALLHLLMKKVETEQRKRLQQLSASQEESSGLDSGSLTLEDKKRLAAEQDSSLAGIKSKASTISEAITTSTSSANQPMKDMWASSPFSPPIVQSSAMVATGEQWMDLDSLFGGSPALIQKPPSSTNPVQAKNMGNSKGGLDLSQFDKLINFPTTQKNEAAPAGNTNGFKDPFDGLLN
uniref:Uncharacterized protein n=1 Tax=Ditylenchus dipsaci TaxID=166011 RepID=A0A915DZ01_9BILA